MAVEASKQVAIADRIVTGFRFRNVSLKAALVVPDTEEGIETSLVFNPRGTGNRKNWQQYDFAIFSFTPSESESIEHCSGSIYVEYDGSPGPVDSGRAQAEKQRSSRRILEEAEALCLKPISTDKVYGVLRAVGLEFGPTFINMDHVKVAGGTGQAVGIVTVPDIAAFMPKNYVRPHTIQPPTMDSMLHIFLAAIMDSPHSVYGSQAMVPTYMGEVYISAATSYAPGSKFICHCRARQLSPTKWEPEVSVWDQESREARVTFKGVQMTPLDSSNVLSSRGPRDLCHRLTWELSVEHVTSTAPIVSRVQHHVDEVKIAENFEKYQTVATLFLADALKMIKSQPTDNMPPHHHKFLKWMEAQISQHESGMLPLYDENTRKKYGNNRDLIQSLHEEVQASGPRGELIMRIGPAIYPIMAGQTDALQLMFRQDDLMQRFYSDTAISGNLGSQITEFFSVIRRSRTKLRILEVGAGTGGATQLVLDSLAPLDKTSTSLDRSAISSYTYTDISMGFFEKARERFEPWSELIEFKTLDVEQEASAQGFELGSFDIVLAANVCFPFCNCSAQL
jgi:hypothetical protein